MSLPFVSRARHDRELAALERLLANAEQAKADARQEALDAMRLHELERRRYDELLATVLAMKTQGAEVVPVAGGIVEPRVIPPDPLAGLKALIGERCGKNYALRGVMLRQLALDVAEGESHEQIEASIVRGVENGEGVPA